MDDDPIREELLVAANRHRDRKHAELTVLNICLAAEINPLELRKALASVFDLSGVEECCSRMMVTLAAVQVKVHEVDMDIRQVEFNLSDLERRIDRLRNEVLEMEGK